CLANSGIKNRKIGVLKISVYETVLHGQKSRVDSLISVPVIERYRSLLEYICGQPAWVSVVILTSNSGENIPQVVSSERQRPHKHIVNAADPKSQMSRAVRRADDIDHVTQAPAYLPCVVCGLNQGSVRHAEQPVLRQVFFIGDVCSLDRQFLSLNV